MNDQNYTSMQAALEYLQYANRFNSDRFVICFDPALELREMLVDVRILQNAGISIAVVCGHSSELSGFIQKRANWGHRLSYVELPEADKILATTLEQVNLSFDNSEVPILGVKSPSLNPKVLEGYAIRLAQTIGARKLFFLGTDSGVLYEGNLLSHVSPKDIQKLITTPQSVNISPERLNAIAEYVHKDLELVLLKGERGSLFGEVFTHLGNGTLFTKEYRTSIRQGTVHDVFEIVSLMRPYIERGTIRPISEEDVASGIENYYVYTVNESIVAAACLIDYGKQVEMAKFCTLNRFRGRGKATELALALLEVAKKKKKKRIFALSTSERMWNFFSSLGFTEVPRESLPEEWQKNYDSKRPSKSFACEL